MKVALISLAAPLLASGMLLAQAPGPVSQAQQPEQPSAQRQATAKNHARRRGQMFDKIAAKLDLSEAQKSQAKAIWKSEQVSSYPLVQQLHSAHVALRAAAKSDKPAEEINKLAGNVGQLTGRLAAVHTKAYEKFYVMLTPEQRTKADQMGGHFRGMFMGGHAHAAARAGAGS